MLDRRLQTCALLVACCLWLAATPIMAQTGSVDLLLEDEIGPVSSLEVGRTLLARVTGLNPGQSVLVILQGAYDWPVVSANVNADESGEVKVAPLWWRTGIVGCDCEADPGYYRFRRAESALEALVGETFEVVVEDLVGNLLASTSFSVVPPRLPIAMSADSTGCPRFLLQDAESLHLLVLGGRAGTRTDVTVSRDNGPIVEVRSSQPEGPTFPLSGSGFEVILLWPGPQTNPGGYRVVVGGGGWPPLENAGGGPINTGVVVEDHSCPPPPGEG